MSGKIGMPEGKDVKWPTPEDRKRACKDFCDHIRKGYSKKSWPEADNETIKKYTVKYPLDFPAADIRKAERESLKFWEGIGITGTMGKLKGFNANSWQFNMQNRAGWSNKQEQSIDVNMKTTGVLVAPSEETPLEWAEKARKVKDDLNAKNDT